MRELRLLLAIVVVASGGCNDPVEPVDLVGPHTLLTTDGVAWGSVIWSSTNCEMRLWSGLVFFADGKFALDLQGRLDCTRGGGSIEFVMVDVTGSYQLDGRLLTLRAATARDSVGFTGRVDTDRILLDLAGGLSGPLGVRECIFEGGVD